MLNPTLVKITAKTATKAHIWGWHGRGDNDDVAVALARIAAELSGADNTIHVMSGTHGFCADQIGAVANREKRFAAEDRALAAPKTKDRHPVKVIVHDFNTGKLAAPDPVTAAMAKLNSDMRKIVTGSKGTHTFLLAYCCSAGTK
jgi:hypothetical protein